jgi:hypothetical protein
LPSLLGQSLEKCPSSPHMKQALLLLLPQVSGTAAAVCTFPKGHWLNLPCPVSATMPGRSSDHRSSLASGRGGEIRIHLPPSTPSPSGCPSLHITTVASRAKYRENESKVEHPGSWSTLPDYCYQIHCGNVNYKILRNHDCQN